jgi:glycosyltransferase involved in cell wall biosynthesis
LELPGGMNPPSYSDLSRHVLVFSDRKPASTLPLASSPSIQLPDLVCLSHLRWNFVFQRPQHLMTRAARDRRVFFVEEPVFDAPVGEPSVEIRQPHPNLHVVVPHLAAGSSEHACITAQQDTVDELLRTFDVTDYVLWYWTPMSLRFTQHLSPTAVVFDCMDELSGFVGAPAALKELERELMARAHVMFTGGISLFEAKRPLHANVHPFPSSVDAAHFAKARRITTEPDDQRSIPGPRIGFFGVIDERMDIDLVAAVADRRPEWQLVLLGPTCKIDPASLPQRSNIHYLGMKSYQQLPEYLAGWDVAMLPFARNDATRFISPTKTPEYLAAGCPVVSTSIRDVVRPYADLGLVHVADDPDGYVTAIETAMTEDRFTRQAKVEACLAGNSWDATWSRMDSLIRAACQPTTSAPVTASVAHV